MDKSTCHTSNIIKTNKIKTNNKKKNVNNCDNILNNS